MTDTYGAAHYLADIHGTEKDKTNCSFYWKVGACRHGESCSRYHNKPSYSQTIIIPHIYPNPLAVPQFDSVGNLVQPSSQQLQEHLDLFYEEMFEEIGKYGIVEELNVCENVVEHMLGNVYIKFQLEEDAQKALVGLNNRFYAGRLMKPEFSPVVDFREAKCKDFETGGCARKGHCNFMHAKKPSAAIEKDCFNRQYKRYRQRKYSHNNNNSSSNSSRKRYRSRSRSRERGEKTSERDSKYSSNSDGKYRKYDSGSSSRYEKKWD